MHIRYVYGATLAHLLCIGPRLLYFPTRFLIMNAIATQWTALLVCMTTISIVAVLLRFFAKYRSKTQFGWDDFWIVVALVVYLAYAAVSATGKLL